MARRGNIRSDCLFVALVMREGYQPARPYPVVRPQGARASGRAVACADTDGGDGRRGGALLPRSARRPAPDTCANRASAGDPRRHHRRPGVGPDRRAAAVARDVPHRAHLCGLRRARPAPGPAFAGAAFRFGAARPGAEGPRPAPQPHAQSRQAGGADHGGHRRRRPAGGRGGAQRASGRERPRRAPGNGAVYGHHGCCAHLAGDHPDGGAGGRGFSAPAVDEAHCPRRPELRDRDASPPSAMACAGSMSPIPRTRRSDKLQTTAQSD